MELPVDERDLDVDHRVPRQDPLGHRLHDALLDRGDELLGIAPEDLVLVDEAFPSRERLDLDLAHRVLPWPPLCFTWRPCAFALARIVSRYAIFAGFASTSTPNFAFQRSICTPRCASPIP